MNRVQNSFSFNMQITNLLKKKQGEMILLIALLLRLLYIFLLPPGQNPDEVYFFERIWSEATRQISFEEKNYPNNEYFYPPFYFLISSFLVRFILNFIDYPLSLKEAFFAISHFFRIFSFVLSIVQVYLIWSIIKKISIPNEVKLSMFTVSVLLPSFVVFGSYLNPNSVLLLLVLLFINVLFDLRMKEFRKSLVLGLISGIALLTKFEGIILPLAGVFYIYLSKRNVQVIKNISIILLISLAIGGWWYLKNVVETGWFYDRALFNSSIVNNIKPFSIPNYLQSLWSWTFETYFFTAGITNNIRFSPTAYLFLKILVLVSVIGVIRSSKKLFSSENFKRVYLTFGVMFLINLLIFLDLNLKTVFQPQGRYFFPTMLFVSLNISIGLANLFGRKTLKLLPLIFIILFLVINILAISCASSYYNRINNKIGNLSCVYYK